MGADTFGDDAHEHRPLLALATGLRETGWAVFDGEAVAASGVVGVKGSGRMEPSVRIAHQFDALTAVALQWKIEFVARGRAGGVNLRRPGLPLLDDALRCWASGLRASLFEYTSREVRAAVAGRHNAPREAQCYAIMQRLRLIGQSRATAEWEAIAVGYYHSALRNGR